MSMIGICDLEYAFLETTLKKRPVSLQNGKELICMKKLVRSLLQTQNLTSLTPQYLQLLKSYLYMRSKMLLGTAVTYI